VLLAWPSLGLKSKVNYKKKHKNKTNNNRSLFIKFFISNSKFSSGSFDGTQKFGESERNKERGRVRGKFPSGHCDSEAEFQKVSCPFILVNLSELRFFFDDSSNV
jgi:hypothetical protein